MDWDVRLLYCSYMKKLLGIIVIGFLLGVNVYAETWTCENYRFGKVIYEVQNSEIILKFPNGDGWIYKIKKDQRQYKISVYGEFINKQTNFDYDIYMDYKGKYVINRTQDALSGYSKSYTDKNCVIFY